MAVYDRIVNMQDWSRGAHFAFFNSFAQPIFNVTATVDVTALRPVLKQSGVTFTVGWLYLLARACNAIPEFRYRIREHVVVEHEVVHPSITVLSKENLFGFCLVAYTEDFRVFAARATEQIKRASQHPSLADEPGRDDVLYMSAMPWLTFTSVTHPMPTQPPDSIPRFAWGKFSDVNGRLVMPLNVQAHHALMDGLHVAALYEELQRLLDRPEDVLGNENRPAPAGGAGL